MPSSLLTVYDYGVIAFYFVFMLAMGWLASRFIRNSGDYFRGGGQMLWWLVGSSAFMTQFSAWTFTGAASKAYSEGWPILVIFFANALGFLKGVVNLRGVIVPIVDLRVKFGCASTDITPITVVIVLNIRGRVVGAVVDSVSDVVELPANAIRPAPEISSHAVDTSYITGLGSVGDRMLILVDIEALMSSADMGLIESAL